MSNFDQKLQEHLPIVTESQNSDKDALVFFEEFQKIINQESAETFEEKLNNYQTLLEADGAGVGFLKELGNFWKKNTSLLHIEPTYNLQNVYYLLDAKRTLENNLSKILDIKTNKHYNKMQELETQKENIIKQNKKTEIAIQKAQQDIQSVQTRVKKANISKKGSGKGIAASSASFIKNQTKKINYYKIQLEDNNNKIQTIENEINKRLQAFTSNGRITPYTEQAFKVTLYNAFRTAYTYGRSYVTLQELVSGSIRGDKTEKERRFKNITTQKQIDFSLTHKDIMQFIKKYKLDQFIKYYTPEDAKLAEEREKRGGFVGGVDRFLGRLASDVGTFSQQQMVKM